MHNKLLTIVVPTYNMELYLEHCLSSLIVDDNQMSLLEVIVVNDGSKDGSLKIARDFAGRYPDTFVIIDKENNNYGSCVNRGIQVASGKYFRILDADDCYSTEELKNFIKGLSLIDADLVFTPFRIIENGALIEKKLSDDIKCGVTYSTQDLTDNVFLLHMHSMTYRTSLLKDSKLTLSERVSYSDTEYCFFPLEFVNDIAFLNNEVYEYNASREGQTTSLSSLKRSTQSMIAVSSRLVDYYYANKHSVSGLVSALWLRLLIQITVMFYKTSLLYCEQNKELSDNIRLLDSKIQQIPELDAIISNLCEHHIHYVKLWRRNGRYYSSVACQIHDKVWDKLDPLWLAFLKRFVPSRI